MGFARLPLKPGAATKQDRNEFAMMSAMARSDMNG
jgi:hypothetical protein